MPKYRADELPEDRTNWEWLNSLSEEELEKLAEPDEENPLWTREAIENAEVVLPGPRKRVSVSLSLYAEVLAYYRAFGNDCETRMNDDLLQLVRSRTAPEPASRG